MKKRPVAKQTSRHQLIARMRRELERRGYPRLQMMLLVALTGGAGFLASYAMLHGGVESLAVRYGLAVGIAYLIFLLLLWVWLRTRSDELDDLGDLITEIADAMPNPAGTLARPYHGGGGNFGGGGASGRWGAGSKSEPLVELPEVPDLPGVGNVADADELAIPLAVLLCMLAIVVTVLAASASIIYSAPILFAELLVDGVLAATLYRRLRSVESRHWLESAVRRTVVPFALVAILLMGAGWGLSIYAPDARTLGEALSGQ